MQSLIVALYLLSIIVSAVGVLGPFLRARSRYEKYTGANRLFYDLRRQYYRDLDAAGEADRPDVTDRYNAAVNAPYKGESKTVRQLGEGWVMKGGSPASEALAEAKSRAAGLGLVVVGVILSGIASILGVYYLP